MRQPNTPIRASEQDHEKLQYRQTSTQDQELKPGYKIHNLDKKNDFGDGRPLNDRKDWKHDMTTHYNEMPRHTTPNLGTPQAPAHQSIKTDDAPPTTTTTPLGTPQAPAHQRPDTTHKDPPTKTITTPTYSPEHSHDKLQYHKKPIKDQDDHTAKASQATAPTTTAHQDPAAHNTPQVQTHPTPTNAFEHIHEAPHYHEDARQQNDYIIDDDPTQHNYSTSQVHHTTPTRRWTKTTTTTDGRTYEDTLTTTETRSAATHTAPQDAEPARAPPMFAEDNK